VPSRKLGNARPAAAFVVQPGFAPFFHATKDEPAFIGTNNDDTDSPVSSSEVMKGRKRRGAHQHHQNLFERSVRIPIPDFRPDRPVTYTPRNGTASQRYRSRPSKLTPVQVTAIRALAHSQTLRAIAGEFGVSHETVRQAIRTGTNCDSASIDS
jgi:DNA-binding CsgD family transcriptional regulator